MPGQPTQRPQQAEQGQVQGVALLQEGKGGVAEAGDGGKNQGGKAGKQVDDEEMRELMKENGIGRPSTRASIIETLFKRQYIERNKKQILPTETGIQLIDIIS